MFSINLVLITFSCFNLTCSNTYSFWSKRKKCFKTVILCFRNDKIKYFNYIIFNNKKKTKIVNNDIKVFIQKQTSLKLLLK